jgi:hypothetical protein
MAGREQKFSSGIRKGGLKYADPLFDIESKLLRKEVERPLLKYTSVSHEELHLAVFFLPALHCNPLRLESRLDGVDLHGRRTHGQRNAFEIFDPTGNVTKHGEVDIVFDTEKSHILEFHDLLLCLSSDVRSSCAMDCSASTHLKSGGLNFFLVDRVSDFVTSKSLPDRIEENITR